MRRRRRRRRRRRSTAFPRLPGKKRIPSLYA
jgi:hypothetical protein